MQTFQSAQTILPSSFFCKTPICALLSHNVSSSSSPAPVVSPLCGAEASTEVVSAEELSVTALFAGVELPLAWVAAGAPNANTGGFGAVPSPPVDSAGAPNVKAGGLAAPSPGLPNEKVDVVVVALADVGPAGAPKLKADLEGAEPSTPAGVTGAESVFPKEKPAEVVLDFIGLKPKPPEATAGAADAAVDPLDPMLNPVLFALKTKGTGFEASEDLGTTIAFEPPPTDFRTSGLMAKMAEGRLANEGGAGDDVGVVEAKEKVGALAGVVFVIDASD